LAVSIYYQKDMVSILLNGMFAELSMCTSVLCTQLTVQKKKMQDKSYGGRMVNAGKEV